MTGVLENIDKTVTIELFPKTYQSEERYDRLLDEIVEKYKLKTLTVVLGRTKDKPRKLTLTFHI